MSHFVRMYVQYVCVFSCVWPPRALCKQQTGLYVRELIPAEQRCSFKMSNQIPFPHFPLTYSLSLSLSYTHMFLFDLHVLRVFSDQVSQNIPISHCTKCVCTWWCIFVCVGQYTACLSCVFILYKRAWPILRELITQEARKEGGMDCHGNQVEHDCM